MTAKIIRLEQFNVGCRHHANGIRFPHIYRVKGFEFDLVDGDLVPGTTTPVETFYALSDQGDFGVANPTFTAIKTLIPLVDKGWIIVRHHASEARAEAYIDCVGDTRPIPYDYSGPMLWQTGEGIFTLMHRPPLAGRPEYLIAYVTKVAVEGVADITEDAFHIVHPDGSVTTDPELMFPSDSEIIGEDAGMLSMRGSVTELFGKHRGDDGEVSQASCIVGSMQDGQPRRLSARCESEMSYALGGSDAV